MSTRSTVLFLAGIFFMFIPAGLLTDIPRLGVNGPLRLVANAVFSGAIAVLYVAVLQVRPRWFMIPVGVQLLITVMFDRLFGAPGQPLTGGALQARLAVDVNISTVAIVISFVLLSNLIRTEGTRYGRMRAEMALARDIHRLLVPEIARQVEGFEFRGVSLPSGDVGGDLIDFVETPQGWTSFVADVSGHGVAAGLLMGMVKSTARTLLRAGADLDRLQDSLNSVLVDLKSPAMFVTFAGVQFDRAAGLRFTVAGHLPILRVRASSAVDELTVPQIPLAMFADRTFTSAALACEPGDLLIILTDGLTEAADRSDREFGLERVKSLVAPLARAPLDAIERRILDEVRAHGPQMDDQTLLLIRAVR